MKQPIFILTLVFGSTLKVLGCSCVGVEPLTIQEVKNRSLIFIGEVIEIDTLNDELEIAAKFRIINKLSSTNSQTDTVVIHTNRYSSMCGVNFNLHDKWYIFPGNEFNGYYSVSLCGRSVLLSRNQEITGDYGLRFIRKTKYHRKEKRRFRSEKRKIKKQQKFCNRESVILTKLISNLQENEKHY